MEVDHLLICTTPGAPEAEALTRFGLTEGSRNNHPGQGTANKRFFFHNAFIELLWLTNAMEAQSELARPTTLYERLTQVGTDISPFGICLRPANSTHLDPPFPTWSYRPSYLPAELSIDVGSATPLAEPLWFFLSFATRPDTAVPDDRQPLHHRRGFKEITSIHLTVSNTDGLSPPALAALQSRCIDFTRGEYPHLEIGFDNSSMGQSHCFSPTLPLTFSW